jgi:hypothetical protein
MSITIIATQHNQKVAVPVSSKKVETKGTDNRSSHKDNFWARQQEKEKKKAAKAQAKEAKKVSPFVSHLLLLRWVVRWC